MTTLVDQLIERFSAVLTTHTANLPGAIPFAAPTRKLAEAAVDVLALGRGVPMIPPYDAMLAAQRIWYGERSAEDLEQGLGFPHVVATLSGDNQVQLTATDADGNCGVVPLPANDAEEFALHVLSVVEGARAAARSRELDRGVFADLTTTVEAAQQQPDQSPPN